MLHLLIMRLCAEHVVCHEDLMEEGYAAFVPVWFESRKNIFDMIETQML